MAREGHELTNVPFASSWGVFTNDRAGATAMKWPINIPIDSISTPFPHELPAYNKPVSLVQVNPLCSS
jgi:hypothetical protein